MERLVKKLRNNRKVVFDDGRFDNWCVYVIEENKNKKAPFDTQYFSALKEIFQHYDKDKVYDDFVKIYELTSRRIDSKVLELIESIVSIYKPEHKDIVEQWFTVIYAGMIAEENKNNAILKKRIKRLGMYQVLILGMEPAKAARYSYGKKWRELDEEMKTYGF